VGLDQTVRDSGSIVTIRTEYKPFLLPTKTPIATEVSSVFAEILLTHKNLVMLLMFGVSALALSLGLQNIRTRFEPKGER